MNEYEYVIRKTNSIYSTDWEIQINSRNDDTTWYFIPGEDTEDFNSLTSAAQFIADFLE